MEIHTNDECQKHWREIFASQIESAINSYYPQENDNDMDRIRWFLEGLRYASMIIRWDETEE
jgi:hypothetical protein